MNIKCFNHLASFASAILVLTSLVGTSAYAQLIKDDRGPFVEITGSPSAPTDVYGRKWVLDENGDGTIREGTVVTATVHAKANGHSAETGDWNRISFLALFATKLPAGITPFRPGSGSSSDEASHTPEDSWGCLDPNYQTQAINCTWKFKWSYTPLDECDSEGKYPIEVSHSWNLLFFYSPGCYWYMGEAKEYWMGNALSFWSAPLGAYNCVAD